MVHKLLLEPTKGGGSSVKIRNISGLGPAISGLEERELMNYLKVILTVLIFSSVLTPITTQAITITTIDQQNLVQNGSNTLAPGLAGLAVWRRRKAA